MSVRHIVFGSIGLVMLAMCGLIEFVATGILAAKQDGWSVVRFEGCSIYMLKIN